MAEKKIEITDLSAVPMENLVRVKQLPIIEEQLRELKDVIEAQTRDAMALVCNADTVQTVKDMRADLNRKFDVLERKRKAVKEQIMEPYDHFLEVYKECVTDPFTRSDANLKQQIDGFEGELKRACEENLQAYFCELRDTRGLPWLEYERAGVKVDMASAKSKTPKKLMEQLKLFVDGVAADIKMIEGMDDAAEIMVEYKATLNAAGSIAAVQQRKKRAEEERQAAEERARRAAEREATAPPEAPLEAPEAYAPPKAVQTATVERMTVRFSVTDTRERLKLLKKFLIENHYDFN